VPQWVLSVPYRLRYRMAFDRGLAEPCSACTRVLCDIYARGPARVA
jgi:hypothetical protein